MHKLLMQARVDDFRRAAAAGPRGRRLQRSASPRRAQGSVTLRFGFPDDADAVARLATIDSSAPPTEPVLLAEVDGDLRAALSLADGAVVADPFHATAALVELLQARSRQLEGGTAAASIRSRHRARFGLPAWR